MRVLPLLATLLISLAACDAGTDTASPSTNAASSEPRLLENGHPLLIPNHDPGVTAFETELLRLINDHRLALGLPLFLDTPLVSDAARAHARHMIEHRFFAHAAPEGLTPAERLALADIDWSAVGENIAAGYNTPQGVYEAWMASPSHRANIESLRFTHAGVGYAQDAAPSDEFPHVHYWSMAFLKR